MQRIGRMLLSLTLSAMVIVCAANVEEHISVGTDAAAAKYQQLLAPARSLSVNTTRLSYPALAALIFSANSMSTNLMSFTVSGKLDDESFSALNALRPVDRFSFVSISGECNVKYLRTLKTKTVRFCYASFLRPEHLDAISKNPSITNIVIEYCDTVSSANLRLWPSGPSLKMITREGTLHWEPLASGQGN